MPVLRSTCESMCVPATASLRTACWPKLRLAHTCGERRAAAASGHVLGECCALQCHVVHVDGIGAPVLPTPDPISRTSLPWIAWRFDMRYLLKAWEMPHRRAPTPSPREHSCTAICPTSGYATVRTRSLWTAAPESTAMRELVASRTSSSVALARTLVSAGARCAFLASSMAVSSS